jgi:hypothetical protein
MSHNGDTERIHTAIEVQSSKVLFMLIHLVYIFNSVHEHKFLLRTTDTD